MEASQQLLDASIRKKLILQYTWKTLISYQGCRMSLSIRPGAILGRSILIMSSRTGKDNEYDAEESGVYEEVMRSISHYTESLDEAATMRFTTKRIMGELTNLIRAKMEGI
jgi:hypothetical protein